MSETFVITRSDEHDGYGVWTFDDDADDLLTPVEIDADARLDRGERLTAVGGYVLRSTPLDHELQQFGFRLVQFDPTSGDPLGGPSVQAGFWDKEKFWNYYEHRNAPHEHQVDDLELIGVTGYVLAFLPTDGRGSFGLWNFDAAADNPGGATDPLPATVGAQGAFPTIGTGHTLLPVGNYVLDWVPETGAYRVFSFDPQLANPLSEPVISSGDVPSDHDRMTVVGDCLLAWSADSRAYTLYRFDPADPFSDDVKQGTLPDAIDAATTLTAVQLVSPPSADVDVPGTLGFMHARIEHVVYYVLESRSFDSVVGWLYENGTDDVNWVHAEAPFQGASESNFNEVGDEQYPQRKVHHGHVSVDKHLRLPMQDPFHDTPDAIRQQWSGGYEAYQDGDPADMGGFVANNGFEQVMAGYTPNQLPVLNGLAEHYALSDEWFCSEAGGTTTNRATMASGSAYNVTASYESGSAYTYFPQTPHRQSLWKVLANNGITDWRIYYSVLWGTPPYPYTYHLFLRNQVPSVDAAWQSYVQPVQSFLEAAANNDLPAFSFIEPVWFDPSGLFTSYHPTGDVIPGEVGLNDIYNAIKDGPGWDSTMLVVSFSKGGGMYDHVPSPRLPKAWPHDGLDGYDFDVAGTRVPTIVVSPWVTSNTVFRSPTDQPFDSTSLAATVLRWLGVPEARWGMGDRVPQAPTFESVLQESRPRLDPPTLGRSFDASYPPLEKVRTKPGTKSHWHIHAGTGRWTNATNWRKGKVPTRKASFAQSDQTEITFKRGSRSTIEHLKFDPDSSGYRFLFREHEPEDPILTITGLGVDNTSERMQHFVIEATSLQTNHPQLVFTNYASAGNEYVHYKVGPRKRDARSGGILTFHQQATAGTASFEVWTGAQPNKNSTVGGEIRFEDFSTAGSGTFVARGTLGADGDTFGNVVFHNHAQGANGTFTNIGATVSRGDGGNTQFFDATRAGSATIINLGATVRLGNGGDVAFDGTATADQAKIANHASPTAGGYGGVTSFNNNWPPMALDRGATAGQATIDNYGIEKAGQGGGGHTKFSGMYGAGDGGTATITNHGAAGVAHADFAGLHYTTGGGNTQFTMSGKAKLPWRPSAGKATINNLGATAPGAQGGYTTFACYDFRGPIPPGPTAGSATITNEGATVKGASGGQTKFSQTSAAGHAKLIANAGTNGGYGGRISFSDVATCDTATVELHGGELDVEYYDANEFTVGSLTIDGGTISCSVGDMLTTVVVSGPLAVSQKTAWFRFNAYSTGLKAGVPYPVLRAEALSTLDAGRFQADDIEGYTHRFEIKGDELTVTFEKAS